MIVEICDRFGYYNTKSNPLLLLPNVGLFHIVYSSVQNKRGIIALSFTACRDMMPDPDFYRECIQRAYDELRESALASTAEPA